jgi:hypothetical protein
LNSPRSRSARSSGTSASSPGRFVIVFPIAVPFIFAVIVLALFANSTRDGGNPFQ